METIDIAFLFASVILALISRMVMKRFVSRRLGRSNAALLEIDFWKATSGETLTRCLLFVELLSWATTALLVATLAVQALQ
ncbi:MAG: hypothetical protein ABSF43_00205 [Rectinemataceae bacterium]|jgi:hypothetical protein